MSREDAPLRIRLPEGLKARIQTHAGENRRSMNAEIVSRLEQSLTEVRLAPPWATEIRGESRERSKKAIAKSVLKQRLDDLEKRVGHLERRLKPKS